MTRDELLGRIGSQELTGWMALTAVWGDEAKHEKDIGESGDGIVHDPYVDGDPDDEEPNDGQAE